METINQRISKYIKVKGYSQKEVAERLGIGQSRLSNIMKGSGSPALDFVQKLLTQFNDLNPEWLLLDTGSMLRENQDQTAEEVEPESKDVSYLHRLLQSKDETIDTPRTLVATLQNRQGFLEPSKKNHAK